MLRDLDMGMKGRGGSRDGEHGELALVLDAEDAQVELDPQVRLPVLPQPEDGDVDPDADRTVDLGHADGYRDAAAEVALEGARFDGGQERELHVDGYLVAVRNEVVAHVDLRGDLGKSGYHRRSGRSF